MKYRLKRILLTIIIIVMFIMLIGCSNSSMKQESIFDMPDSFWDVFLGELSGNINSDGEDKQGFQVGTEDYVNYYEQGVNVITNSLEYHEDGDEHSLVVAKDIMRRLMNTFHLYGYFPRPEYKSANYEYGWVSSMDAPVIMVGAQMLYEITNNDEYSNFINELVPYVTSFIQENGFNYYLDKDKIWPLEYARKESSDETNMYVLNGSLTGYVAVVGVNKVINNQELSDYIKSVEKAYNSKLKEFHYTDNLWTYYMINPKTVIPVHYLIYEEKLFQAGYDLNKLEFFKEEYEYRKKLVLKTLGAQFFQKDDGLIEYYILRSGIPNEYQIDSYQTKVEFIDNSGTVVQTDIAKETGTLSNDIDTFYKGMFMHGNINENVESYRVLSFNGATWYQLFEEPVRISDVYSIEKLDGVEVTTVLDAELDGKNISIKPELSDKQEGDIVFTFPEIIEKGRYYFAIEIENREENETSIGMKIYDESKQGVTRYYTTLLPGKNLLLFDSCGFAGSDQLSGISSIWIRIYENKENSAQYRLGNVYKTDNLKGLYEYIQSTEYKIHPQ